MFLATVLAIQRFRHYILLRTTIIIADSNPMYHILTKQVLGGKYSHWIISLQKFDLEFLKDKSKKSLVFVELMCGFLCANIEFENLYSLPDKYLFFISTTGL